jgi:uncharacterized protein involved in outer membrane biogenesis
LALQTTLLGLAIAIILTLLAALVGPLLIDWGNHRSLFETEASRIIGTNVRVTGRIDARLLPSPRLILHDIAIGEGENTIRADSLGIEFMLGPLMRGEWRAAQMHLAGPRLSLGLDSSGHVRAPNLAGAFKPDELSVDRLSIEGGTIILATAANGASITLERIRFIGEARSLAGPVRGEGDVTIAGKLYPFRIASGRLSEDGALKLHINVDPAGRLISIEGDGTLTFAGGEPHFDGTLNLSRPVGLSSRDAVQRTDTLTQPWRLSAKVKATGKSALMQNVEFQYGSEEQGIRLTGVADFRFGADPRADGVLSGRQIDLDRFVSSTNGARPTPAAAIRKLAELSTAVFRPVFPIQIGIGIDQLTLGGNAVQNLRADISSRTDEWSLDRLEFRAPGLTQVRLSGRLTLGTDGIAFAGPAEIDASDPKMLAAWLEGRSGEPSQSELRPLSLRGEVTLASDKIAVERFKAEFDRKPVTGRLAYIFPSGDRQARLDAELKAPVLDVDAALDFGRALLAGTKFERPREIALAAEIGVATIGGIQTRDVRVRATLDGAGLQLDRLSVADFNGGSFAASGRIETGKHAPRGTLSVDVEAKKTAVITEMIEKFAPKGASPVKGLLDRIGRAKLHATLDISGENNASASVAQLALAGDLDEMRVNARARMSGDWTKPSASNIRANATIDTPTGAPLIELMGLGRIVAVGKGPGQLKLQVAGQINGETTLDIQVSAGGLLAQGSGRGQLSEDQGATVAATLQVLEADLGPLRPTTGADIGAPLPLKLTSRVAIAKGVTTFENIDAKVGESSIRGYLAVDSASPRRIDGMLKADSVDGPALVARAAGLPVQGAGTEKSWSSEPFGIGVFGKFSGKIPLTLTQVILLPRLTAREFNATLRLGTDEIALDDVTGNLAGGRLSGGMTLRRAADGLTAHAKVLLADSDAAALFPAAARSPISGSLGLTAEVDGTGLSPVALMGALKGSGRILLVNGQLAGLDPRTFDTVTRAVDQGLAVENTRISDLVSKSLDGGLLSVKRAEAGVSIAAGQLRLNNVNVESKNAALSVVGMLDLTDSSINSRLALSGQSEAAGSRPDIVVTLKGPLASPSRSVDVSALTGWLTLRSVENQTKRLHAIENAPQQPRGRAAPKSKQAPALPAPIDIRPAPAPRSAGQPAGSGSRN